MHQHLAPFPNLGSKKEKASRHEDGIHCHITIFLAYFCIYKTNGKCDGYHDNEHLHPVLSKESRQSI